MNNVDFLSVYPQVYVGNKIRAKNKFGGFLSSMYILIMLGVLIFYLTIYVLGKNFNVKFFRSNISFSSLSEFNDLKYKEKEFFLNFESEINDCRIHPFLFKNNNYYDESNIDKCNENLDIDPNGSYYCFNLSFSDNFSLGISGNCSNKDGKPYETDITIMTTVYKIDHKSKYPFQKLERKIDNLISSKLQLITSKNAYYSDYAKFTIVSYESDKIFSNKKDVFHELYLSNIKTLYYSERDTTDFINNKTINRIYSLMMTSESNYDFYKREYISLLDTLSNIGGFFSSVKLAFSI